MPTFNFKMGEQEYSVDAPDGVDASAALKLVAGKFRKPATPQAPPLSGPSIHIDGEPQEVTPGIMRELTQGTPAEFTHQQAADMALQASKIKQPDAAREVQAPESGASHEEIKRQDFTYALGSSPELKAYAAQSQAHAATVQDDAGPLATLSHWLAGRFTGVEQYLKRSMYGQKPDDIQYEPPIAAQALVRGTKAAYAQTAESLSLIAKFTGNPDWAPREDQMQAAQEIIKENSKPIPGAESGVGKAVAGALEMIPGLVPLALAPELAAPQAFGWAGQAAFRAALPTAILAFQNVGMRYQELKSQRKPDGAPLYTDDEAQQIAGVGSLLGGAIGAQFASKFVTGLLPSALQKYGPKAFSKAITDLMASRGLLAQVGGMAGAAQHAMMFNYGLQLSESVAEIAGKRLVTGEWDDSILSAGIQKANEGTLSMMPLVIAPGVARMGRISADRLGKWVDANGERAELAGMHEEISKVKQVPPSEMVKLLDDMLARNPSRQTVYIDAEKFAAAALANKIRPEALSDAYEGSRSTGIVPMKTSHFLLMDGKVRDALLDHTKFTADGFNFAEAQKVTPTIGDDLHMMRDWEAWANEEQPPPGSPERREPTRKPEPYKTPISLKLGKAAMKQRANEHVADLPIGKLADGQKLYEAQAKRAQGDLEKSQLQALNEMAEATKKLQGEAGKAGQKAEDASVKATGSEVKAGEKAAHADKMQAQRDASEALAAAHERALKKATKIGDGIAKLSENREAFENSATDEAGPEYLDIFDTIGHHLGTGDQVAEPITDPEPLYRRMEREGLTETTVPFDMKAFAAWLKSPKDLGAMNVAEAGNVLSALKTFRRAVSQFDKIKSGEQSLTRQEWAVRAWRELERHGLEGGQFEQGKADSWVKRWRAEKTSPALLWEPIDKTRMDEFYKARNNESDMLHEHLSNFQKIFFDKLNADLTTMHGEMGAAFNGIDSWSESKLPMLAIDREQSRLQFHPKEISRKDMWYMALQSGNESGMAKMARGFGVEPVDIASYLNTHMTKPEWDAVSRIHRTQETLREKVFALEERKYGTAPEKLKNRVISTPFGDYEGGYAPFRWHETATGLPARISDTDAFRGATGGMDTHTGAVEARADQFTATPDIRWDNLPGHYKQLIHHIAFSEYTRENYALLNDPMVESMIKNKLGDAHYQAMWDAHDTTALGQDNAAVYANRVFPALLRQGMGIAARAVFNYNLPIQLGQYGHALTAGMAFGATIEQVRDGYIASLSPEKRAQALQECASLRYRAQDYVRKVIEQEEAIGGYKTNRYLNLIDKPGRMYMAFQDGQISHAMYETAKAKALGDGKSYLDAVAHAERVVNLGMPKLNSMEQSAFVRDNGVIGLVNLVRNYPNEITNMYAAQDWSARAGISDGGSRFAIYGGQALQALATAGSLAVTHYLIGHGRNKEEAEGGTLGTMRFFARSLIESSQYGNPILHPISQVVAPLMLGETVHTAKQALFRVPVVDMINDLGQRAKEFAHDPSKEGAYMKLVGTFGKLFFGAHPIRILEADDRLRSGDSMHFQPTNDFSGVGARFYGNKTHTNPTFDFSEN